MQSVTTQPVSRSPLGCRLAQILCMAVARGPYSHIVQGLGLGFRVENRCLGSPCRP